VVDELHDDADVPATGGRARRRWPWIVLVGALVAAAVLFVVFRPDKAFTDTEVNDPIPAEIQQAIAQGPAPSPEQSEPEEATSNPEPTVIGEGEFVSQGGHSALGRAVVVQVAGGSRQLILSDLDVDNGPDLKVFMSPSSEGNVDGGVNLAPLKGNKGTQMYDLPAEVDLGDTPNVVIWCERFATPFGTATLQS